MRARILQSCSWIAAMLVLWTGEFAIRAFPRALQRNSADANHTEQQERDRFKPVSTADSAEEDGTILGSTLYRNSTGASVSVAHAKFPSAEAADAKLTRSFKQAIKVISRESRKDSSGQAVGERVVAVFLGDGSEYSAILWTDGRDYYRITAASLQIASEFETRLTLAGRH